MQRLLHAQQLLPFALQHPGYGYARPLRHDAGDFVLGHGVAEQLHLPGSGVAGAFDLLLELRDSSVLQLGHACQVAAALRRLQLRPRTFQRLLDVLDVLDFGLLSRPDFLEIGEIALRRGNLRLQSGKPLARGVVALLAEGLAFDLELDQPPFEPIHGLGLRVDLHAYPARGLVHEVDRLVGKLPVRDVAVGQRRSGDESGVRDVHAVVDLVALLEAAQDRDGVLDRGLVHQDLLEAPLERRVLLDVAPVLVEGGRADAVQLAPRERGLEHVPGVHRAFRLSGSDQGVNFVDEQDDPALLLREVVEHGLHPFLELAAVLRSRDQRAHVQRQETLVLEALGDFGIDDSLRQSLDDRRLPHAGLADQHRVVLGTPLQHLDGAANLVVASDHRVELALLGPLGEIDGELLQRPAMLLRIRVGHRFAPAHRIDRPRDRLLRGAVAQQQLRHVSSGFEAGEGEQLARNELVLSLLRELVAKIEVACQIAGDLHVAGDSLDPGQRVERDTEL